MRKNGARGRPKGAATTWTNNLITGTTCYGHNATDSDPMMTRAGRPRTRKNELMPPPCKTEKIRGRGLATRPLPGRTLAAARRTLAARKRVNLLAYGTRRPRGNHTSDLFSHDARREESSARDMRDAHTNARDECRSFSEFSSSFFV